MGITLYCHGFPTASHTVETFTQRPDAVVTIPIVPLLYKNGKVLKLVKLKMTRRKGIIIMPEVNFQFRNLGNFYALCKHRLARSVM